LGLHRKPIGFLNIRGYFDDLMKFVDHAVSQRFVRAEHRAMILSGDDPGELIVRLEAYHPPDVEKWLDR
jgi:predicted Rossmann-fold nucleotide-binding protein